MVALAERLADVAMRRDTANAFSDAGRPYPTNGNPVAVTDVGRQSGRALEQGTAVFVQPVLLPLASESREFHPDAPAVAASRVPGDVAFVHTLDDAVRVDAVVRRHLGARMLEPPRARLRSVRPLRDLHRMDDDEVDRATPGPRPVRAFYEDERHDSPFSHGSCRSRGEPTRFANPNPVRGVTGRAVDATVAA